MTIEKLIKSLIALIYFFSLLYLPADVKFFIIEWTHKRKNSHYISMIR
ncbi:hypothetical protein D1AOALGA4SA_10387 [Olavius algarvensis Delta 1 endosymbiont]|nr:hypothetical protein D1AOALGA4SA_10387 [Olavius algarvensis Delta 1 endosymbiont]